MGPVVNVQKLFFFVVEAADNKLECLHLANLFQSSLIFMGTYGRVVYSTQVSNKFYVLIQIFPFMQIVDCREGKNLCCGNTLAYFAAVPETEKKSFMRVIPGWEK